MTGWEKVETCFTNSYKETTSPPKGEIWIAKEVLENQGLPGGPEGIVGLALKLKTDLCFFSFGGFLPVSDDATRMAEAVKMSKSAGLACGAVVDGPWQRLSESEDLMQLLLMIRKEHSCLTKKLAARAAEMEKEAAAWKKAGVDLLLIADDVAHNGGPYFSTHDFNQLLIPFYKKCMNNITASKSFHYGFHSDGNLKLLMPALVERGFSFFSLEPEATDLEMLWRLYGRQTIFMSGIRAAWLAPCYADLRNYPKCQDILKGLPGGGNLILSSTCGLYHPYAANMLKNIYSCIDNVYT